MIIAIDGFAASGKGTLATILAERLGYARLDTGLIYRATGLGVLEAGGDPENPDDALAAAESLTPALLEDGRLREPAVTAAAYKVAAQTPVRDALRRFQKDFAANPPGGAPGAILDGRDIGTVICPDADVKLFVSADVEIRAKRRFEELQSQGKTDTYPAVLQAMKDRDASDAENTVPADDAVHLDTTALTIDQVVEKALSIIEARRTS
ncbi:MAG: (d)CMP kinase [Alphaproteobacteria bacterium]|nr:(d)CMP kinase [Alphaproteobacteria bacterium]